MNNAMQILWQYSHKIWLIRNEILHEKGRYNKVNDISKIDAKIKHQFRLGTQDIKPIDKQLIKGQTAVKILSRQPAHRRRWLRNILKARCTGRHSRIEEQDQAG